MSRQPRNPTEPVFGLRTTVVALIQGFSALAVVAGMFLWALHGGKSEWHARGLAFTTLIVANLALIWTNRSWSGTIVQTFRSRNVALWTVTAGALTLLGLVLNVPFLNGLFRISNLDFRDLALCVLAGCVSIVSFEALKLFARLSHGPVGSPPRNESSCAVPIALDPAAKMLARGGKR